MVISALTFSRIPAVTIISYTFKNDENKILDVIFNSDYDPNNSNAKNGKRLENGVRIRQSRSRQQLRRSGFNREARYGGDRDAKAKSWSPFNFDVVSFQNLDPFADVRFILMIISHN